MAKEEKNFLAAGRFRLELADTFDAKGRPAVAGHIDTQRTTGREIGSNLSLT